MQRRFLAIAELLVSGKRVTPPVAPRVTPTLVTPLHHSPAQYLFNSLFSILEYALYICCECAFSLCLYFFVFCILRILCILSTTDGIHLGTGICSPSSPILLFFHRIPFHILLHFQKQHNLSLIVMLLVIKVKVFFKLVNILKLNNAKLKNKLVSFRFLS